MLYKLTEQGKQAYQELIQQRRYTNVNPNVAIALQTVVDVVEDGIVSDAEIQKKFGMYPDTVKQLIDLLLSLGLLEPTRRMSETDVIEQAHQTRDLLG